MQDLRQRIRDSYEARWKAEKHFNEEEILEELPSSLRTEVRKIVQLAGHVELATQHYWSYQDLPLLKCCMPVPGNSLQL